MPQVGPLEILVVGIIALIVFGPQKLPEIARTIGRALTELRRMASEVRSEFEMGLDDVEDEPEDPPETSSTSAPPPTTPTAEPSPTSPPAPRAEPGATTAGSDTPPAGGEDEV